MAPIAESFVRVRPDVDRFGTELSTGVGRQSAVAGAEGGKRFGGTFVKSLGGTLAGLGVSRLFGRLVRGLGDSIKAASDLGETQSKVNVIFGKQGAKALDAFASGSATALGQSKQSALDAAATFGVFGKAAGLAGTDLAGFSSDFVGLSSDLASFSNTSPEEAIQAITSALQGEAEPIRKYGILLDDATLRQEALRLGLVKTTKDALTPQQRVLAAQASIYKQTSDAQGDFARTSGGLANQQRILSAQVTDLKGRLGQALLPAVTAVVHGLSDFIKGAQDGTGAGGAFADKLRDLAAKAHQAFDYFQTSVLPHLQEFGRFITGTVVPALSDMASFIRRNADFFVPFAATIVTVVAAWKTYVAITKTLTAVQLTLNAVMAANPIGLVVIAVAGLVAGLIVAYKRSETFRDVVNGAFTAVQTVVGNVISVLVTAFRGLLKAWTTVIGGILGAAASIAEKLHLPFAHGLRAASDAFNGFAQAADDKLAGIASSASRWGEQTPKNLGAGINGQRSVAVAAAGAMANKVGSQFEGVTGVAYQAGSNLALGFANGISKASQRALDAAGAMGAKATQILRQSIQEGSPSKLTEQSGVNFGDGFALGIDKSAPHAVARAKAMADKVVGAVTDRLDKAKGRLSDLLGDKRSAFTGVAGSVTGGIVDALTAKDADGNPVGALAGVQGLAGQAGAFAAALGQLVSKGIPGSVISAIAAAGPVTGLEAANNVLSSDIGALKTAFGQVDTAARAAGKIIAEVEVPAALIKAQQDQVTLLGAAVAELRNPGKADTVTLRIDKGGDLIVEYVNRKNGDDKRKGGARP